MFNQPGQDPAGAPEPTPHPTPHPTPRPAGYPTPEAGGHHETPRAPTGWRTGSGAWRGGSPAAQAPSAGRRAGRLAVFLGGLALVTSIAVIGGLIGVAAIVAGMRARRFARRGDAGGGTGTAGVALGALSLLIAFTVTSGMWVLYERHGDDLHDYQECRRGARSVQELDDCSRRFNEAVRTDPTSKG
ncbi:hypothetical protein UG55_109917 [Frankia sp. EI5c]|uniref:hypothetical protein n=1 Tax=Frankia sp. EI5c TaxID=683316 RepID=UPI0007C21722|nr:hypothetical protein [Frankia sp. EI5c]OAA18814.1 hypothetical protein UG55_109917 [Frankia sp. EI5c]